MSGAFTVGEGSYAVEVAVTGDQSRVYRKSWKLRVGLLVPSATAIRDFTLTVEPLDRADWQITPPQMRSGIYLTILLDAAPINATRRNFSSELTSREMAEARRSDAVIFLGPNVRASANVRAEGSGRKNVPDSFSCSIRSGHSPNGVELKQE